MLFADYPNSAGAIGIATKFPNTTGPIIRALTNWGSHENYYNFYISTDIYFSSSPRTTNWFLFWCYKLWTM